MSSQLVKQLELQAEVENLNSQNAKLQAEVLAYKKTTKPIDCVITTITDEKLYIYGEPATIERLYGNSKDSISASPTCFSTNMCSGFNLLIRNGFTKTDKHDGYYRSGNMNLKYYIWTRNL